MKSMAISALLFLTLGWPALVQAQSTDPIATSSEAVTGSETAEGSDTVPEPTAEERRANGKALVQEVLKAHGGDAFVKQTSQVSKGVGRLRPLGQASSTDLEHLAVYKNFPLQDRIEMKTPQGDILQVFDGAKGWVLNIGQLIDQTAQLKNRRHYGYDVLRRYDDTFIARQLDDEIVEDRTFSVVRLKDEAGHHTKFYVDQSSHRVYQVIYTLDTREVTERYTEYRKVSDVQVPFRIELYQGSAKVLEFEVGDVEINPDLDDALFAMPSNS